MGELTLVGPFMEQVKQSSPRFPLRLHTSLVKHFPIEVAASNHLDALKSTGNDLVCTIRYANMISELIGGVYQSRQLVECPNFHVIRNYLLGKIHRMDEESAIQVFTKMDCKDNVSYDIAIDPQLLQLLANKTKSPTVHANLKIILPGVEMERPEYCLKSDLLAHTATAMPNGKLPMTLVPSKVGLTKQLLEQSEGNLTFECSLNIEFDDYPDSDASFSNTSTLAMQQMYRKEDKDLTIITKGDGVLKCHKNVLKEQCPKLLDKLEGNKIELTEYSKEGVEWILKFCYGFKIQPALLTPEVAVQLFQLCFNYEMEGLKDAILEFLICKSIAWFTMDSILELYFFIQDKQELEALETHILIEIPKCEGVAKTIGESEYFRKLESQEAIDFVAGLLQWKKSK